MIGRLRGEVARLTPESVLLDVGGVGYDLQIPLGTYYALAGSDGPATLFVHTHVREDALSLYGFVSEQERTAFLHCLGVSGIGPRTALAVLSGIGVDELERAVLDDDRARLQRIPGIGRKTAERLLLELRDRVGESAAAAAKRSSTKTGGAAAPAVNPLQADALSALVNLGFPRETARKAIAEAVEGLPDDATLEALLRRTLGRLVR